MVIITTVCLILSSYVLVVRGDTRNNNDKLVLSPVQIIDMVMKEKVKNNTVRRDWRFCGKRHTLKRSQQTSTELSELSDDETRLKLRKVWCRWGKWGECSATCGGGVMRRERTCVAGRCAPGEHEEQSRPCASTPCTLIPLPLADDSHELE